MNSISKIILALVGLYIIVGGIYATRWIVLDFYHYKTEISECSKNSAEFIKNNWQDKSDVKYTSHYNSKLKICFIKTLVNYTDLISTELIDINKGETYASLDKYSNNKINCKIKNRDCTIEDFESYVNNLINN